MILDKVSVLYVVEAVMQSSHWLWAVLLPPKAFDGIMNEQKMRKVHQNAKEKEGGT